MYTHTRDIARVVDDLLDFLDSTLKDGSRCFLLHFLGRYLLFMVSGFLCVSYNPIMACRLDRLERS